MAQVLVRRGDSQIPPSHTAAEASRLGLKNGEELSFTQSWMSKPVDKHGDCYWWRYARNYDQRGKKRLTKRRLGMGRTAMMLSSVAGIVGSFALIVGAFFIGGFGAALWNGAPHAFPPDIRTGVILLLVALLMTVAAVFLLLRSARRLRRM